MTEYQASDFCVRIFDLIKRCPVYDVLSVENCTLWYEDVWRNCGISSPIFTSVLESRVEAGSNTSVVALRVVEGDEMGT
jgi:hypothetical protein